MRVVQPIGVLAFLFAACSSRQPLPQTPCECPAENPPRAATTAAPQEASRPAGKFPDTFAGFSFGKGLSEAEAACPGRLEITKPTENIVFADCHDADVPAPYSGTVRLVFGSPFAQIHSITVDVSSVEQGLKALVQEYGAPDSVSFCRVSEESSSCTWSHGPSSRAMQAVQFTWVFDDGMIHMQQGGGRPSVAFAYKQGTNTARAP